MAIHWKRLVRGKSKPNLESTTQKVKLRRKYIELSLAACILQG